MEQSVRQKRGRKTKFDGGTRIVTGNLPISEIDKLDEVLSRLSNEDASLYTKSAVYRLGIHKFLSEHEKGTPYDKIFKDVL